MKNCQGKLNCTLVLSNELIKVKLPMSKLWKADILNVSPFIRVNRGIVGVRFS